MWRCPHCEFVNEGLETACQRCGELRPSIPADIASANTPAAQPKQPRGAAEEKRRTQWLVWLLAMLFLLVGMTAVGYAAWLRGMVVLPGPIERWLQSYAAPALLRLPAIDDASGSRAREVAPVVPPELLELEILQERQYRVLADRLSASRGALRNVQLQAEPAEQDEQLRSSQLEELRAALPELLATYDDFENAAARASSTQTEQLQVMRGTIVENLTSFLQLLGRSYRTDPDPARADYMQTEQVVQALARRGQVDPVGLRQVWLDAVAAREQYKLDLQYTAEYERLAAWLATLRQLREKFNATAEELPSANMPRGMLTEGAEQLLVLYNEFAHKLETLWPEWVKFQEGLPVKSERPKRMNEQLQVIEETLISELLDCFTQMYRIYARDRNLEHPAYQELVGVHFEFVSRNLRERAPQFRAVSQEYEAEWDRNFRRNRDSAEGAESGRDSQLMGPPGFLPDP